MVRPPIEITQDSDFPSDFNQFLILAIGSGALRITLSKTDTQRDFLVLAGWAVSSAGTVPFLRLGITPATLKEGIEIGPLGLVWLVTWVDSPEDEPLRDNYNYTLGFEF